MGINFKKVMIVYKHLKSSIFAESRQVFLNFYHGNFYFLLASKNTREKIPLQVSASLGMS